MSRDPHWTRWMKERMVLQGGSTSSPDRAAARGWRCDVWAVMAGNELVGPFRVPDGVKMTSKRYIDFPKEHLVAWYKKKSFVFRKNMVFMHDNAPSHAARFTTEYLASVFARHKKIMQWPSAPQI